MKPEGKIGSPDTAWTPQVRIKICGLTRTEDVRLAVTLGADYLGFIFASSPRQVAVEAVQAILSSLEQEQSGKLTGVERVGVFVNADRYLIEETARRANLTVLQLHGDEDPEFCSRFELPVIKALRIRDRERKLIFKIREALERIDAGTYGVCEICGCEIAEKRLLARPVTTMCIACKSRMEDLERARGA